ncbi:MAG: DUF502 domain-containing protein [Pseudorhodoplanes sp.]|nr:MAG: DUF502 domain-containing protein [Pseudorhodoplanes sp.]
MTYIVRTLLAGLLVLLPLAITVILVVWLGAFVLAYLGPNSAFGQFLTVLGLGLSASEWVAYLIGIAILLFVIYVMGLVVESRMRSQFSALLDSVVRRIPFVRNIYDLSKRFVDVVDYKDRDGLRGMSPVWCHFGGKGGAAVLALLPNREPVMLSGAPYHAILVPSAPVPVGGGLVYVPSGWIEPADIGVEGLMSVYVSMGVAPPRPAAAAGKGQNALPPHATVR